MNLHAPGWMLAVLASLASAIWLASRLALHLRVDLLGREEPKPDMDLSAEIAVAGLQVRLRRPYDAAGIMQWQLCVWGKRIIEGQRGSGQNRGRSKTTKPSSPSKSTKTKNPGRMQVDWSELLAWVLEQRRHIDIVQLDAQLQLGLADPASTGQLHGLCQALSSANLSALNIEIEPVFDRPCRAGQAHAHLRLRPLALVLAALWFAMTRVRFFVIRPSDTGLQPSI